MAAACSAAILILAPAAGAHGGSSSRGLTERQLRAGETRLLGPRHAAEHAAERAFERRWRRMSPGKRRAVRAREARTALFATRAAGDPSDVGAWDTDLDGTNSFFKLRDYAINLVMLPTGKVIMWGYPQLNRSGEGTGNHGDAWLWDPSKGYGQDAFTRVTPPTIPIAASGPGATPRPVPIFCSGGSLLANGTLLVAGGNLDVTGSKGINTIFTFDPFTQAWHRQGNSPRGHWYPTQTLLPDGRTIILSGYTETGSTEVNQDFEIWPARGTAVPGDEARTAALLPVEHITSADKSTYVYPHLFVTASGRVALTGPASFDVGLLDLSSFTWADPSPLPYFNQDNVARIGSNAVLEPAAAPGGLQRITIIGGFGGTADSNGQIRATESTLSIQPDAASPSWSQTTNDQSVARSYANTVQLPDGSMVTIGGGAGSDSVQGGQGGWWTDGDDARLRQVELFDPATRTWRAGPEQQHFRAYHSTAVLLPDGRVLSAGDDSHEDQDNVGMDATWIGDAEIYKPPYLFKGARPAIASGGAPGQVAWGSTFSVSTDQSKPAAARAVLVAPSAATHGADMSQRYVPLETTAGAGTSTITVKAPASGALAPPGYYMLFVLSDDGVPSVAKWVQLGPTVPTQPVTPVDPGQPATPVAPAGTSAETTPDATPVQTPSDDRPAPEPAKPAVRTLRVSVRTTGLESLLRSKHVTLRLTSSRAVRVGLAIDRGAKRLSRLRTVTFTKAGTRTVRITLSARARRDLRVASSRRIKVVVRFPAGQKWTVTGASALLR